MKEQITIKLTLDHGQVLTLATIVPEFIISCQEFTIKESTNKLLKAGSSATYLDTYDVTIVVESLSIALYVGAILDEKLKTSSEFC